MNWVASGSLLGNISLFGKVLMMVALVTALTSALITWNAQKMLFQEVESGIALLAADASLGASVQIAGALKFRKTDIIQTALEKLKTRSGGRFLGGLALDPTLQEVASVGAISPENADSLKSLAKRALEERTLSVAASGMLVAAPVLSADSAQVVGVLALEWSAQTAQEYIQKQQLRASSIALFAFLILFAASAFFLTKSLKRPVKQLETAMAIVAGGDYDTANLLASRSDEIGSLAKALDKLRDHLSLARQAELEKQASAQVQGLVVKWLSDGLQQLAQGKLSYRLLQEFPDDYLTLKDNFNAATEHLTKVMSAVVQAGNQIDTVAQSIREQSDNLANRTENQAATLEQTAAALDEMTSHVKKAAQSTKQIDGIVQQAETEAVQTNDVVADSVAAMKEIEAFSKQISAIIGVIDDIAFQTNLLSLNAGVEAARAGDSGRGFAVVASEVGSLAHRSSEAAREIKTLINSSSNQVAKGVEHVALAGAALTAIVARVQAIASSMSAITEGAAMQASGLTEINIGMRQLDQVTQYNAAMVLEAGDFAAQLAKEVGVLKQSVARFDIETATVVTEQVQMDSAA
jgi:methyl-accepting chemotaxis protein